MKQNDFETLERDDALALWRRGKDAWNAWVEENPRYNVDFSGVNFSQYGAGIPFAGFVFPEGVTTFSSATFEGDASFFGATFEGKTYFNNTTFKGATFSEATFESKTYLSEFTFKGKVDFSSAIFRSEAYFSETTFGGEADFTLATFKSDAYFFDTTLGKGNIVFDAATFSGGAYFTALKNIGEIKSFSFRYAVFEGPLDISSEEVFPCPIDLTQTRTAHHVSLSGVT